MNNYPRSYPCCGTDPLVYAGNPFIWQAAMQAGRTFYNYGEFGPLPSMQRHSDNQYNAKYRSDPGPQWGCGALRAHSGGSCKRGRSPWRN